MATPSRSLADDIRGRSDAELIDLVLARPDLARPAPADLTSLAARAGTRASVQRAVEALDRGHLQVLEAVVVAGDAAERSVLLHLLGTDDAGTVDAIVQDLWRSALVWRGVDGDHVVRTVPEVLGTAVAGLGAPMRELRPSSPPEDADPDRIRATVAEAPDDSRAMLERMTWGPAFGVLPAANRPVSGEPYDFRERRPVGGARLDTAYTDVLRDADGMWRATVAAADRTTTLWADAAFPWLQVFTAIAEDRKGEVGIAVEPMSCPADAFNSGDGLVVLAPGEEWTGTWGISPS